MTDYTINAEGKALGRVASEAAKALMGKMSPSYTPHIPSGVKVTITNASKVIQTDRKNTGKVYSTYSGYPGGMRKESLAMLTGRKGHAEPIRRAIMRMLPKNRLRPGRMKNLTISA
jgi:large subunit ribosomal protein L13